MNPYLRRNAPKNRWEIGQMLYTEKGRTHGKPEKTFPLAQEAEARAYFDSLPKGTPEYRLRTPCTIPGGYKSTG